MQLTILDLSPFVFMMFPVDISRPHFAVFCYHLLCRWMCCIRMQNLGVQVKPQTRVFGDRNLRLVITGNVGSNHYLNCMLQTALLHHRVVTGDNMMCIFKKEKSPVALSFPRNGVCTYKIILNLSCGGSESCARSC